LSVALPIEDMTPIEVAAIVDGACRTAQSYVEIGGRLNDAARLHAGDDAHASALGPFVSAFSYDLAERNTERRETYGPFAPMFETATHSFPAHLGDVGADVAAAWAEVHGRVREPAARARLADLLWTKKATERPDLLARDAVASYRRVAAEWTDLDAGDALTRSLEIALQLNDSVEAQLTAERIVEAAEQALAETDQKPGVSLRLIEALVEMPAPPVELDELLDRAVARYQANIHVGDSIADMCAARAGTDAERVTQIRKEQAQRWLSFSATCEPLVALHHLQHGLELAKTFALSDEQTQFRLALQQLDQDNMGFEHIHAEAPVDREAIEQLIESMVESSWPESLTAFGATGPPTGDAAQNEAMVRQMMRDYPLTFLFGRVELGSENTIIRNASSDEEKLDAELVAHESRSIVFWGQLSIEVLRRVVERNGVPALDELLTHFTTGVVSAEIADSLARAVDAYLNERYDEASLLLAVRIETVIRELARRTGLVVNREPVGTQAGGVRSLGAVLTSLRPYFADESWWRYLWSALAEPRGLNLRNRLAHGLMEGTQVTAAVLLHVACFLAILGPASPDEEPPSSAV
jgi:hypothetical protein